MCQGGKSALLPKEHKTKKQNASHDGRTSESTSEQRLKD